MTQEAKLPRSWETSYASIYAQVWDFLSGICIFEYLKKCILNIFFKLFLQRYPEGEGAKVSEKGHNCIYILQTLTLTVIRFCNEFQVMMRFTPFPETHVVVPCKIVVRQICDGRRKISSLVMTWVKCDSLVYFCYFCYIAILLWDKFVPQQNSCETNLWRVKKDWLTR